MTMSCTLSSSHSKLVKLICDFSANASTSLSNFALSDVISSTLFHSSPGAPTSCCSCIPHACVHFISSMLWFSVHHPDFMAHDVSASRNLDFRAALGNIAARFVQCSRSVPSSASCRVTPGWCAHRLLCKEVLLTDANCESLSLFKLFAPGCEVPLACSRERASVVFQRNVDGRMIAAARCASKFSPLRACTWHER